MTPRLAQQILAAELPPRKARALLEGSGPSLVDLAEVPGLPENALRSIRTVDLAALDRAIAQGAEVLAEEDFPDPLLAAENVPPCLFVHGNPRVLHAPCVGIVGTRTASNYGKAVAQKFAEVLAAAGITIVSGGALGIDAAAHTGALNVGGKTAVVLPTGIDVVYPRANEPLFRRVRESGVLVSQWAVGNGARGYTFLERNGVIAALCTAVIVIEAPARSGAMRTARDAAELGRDVYVVPGDIGRTSFHGSFSLIDDGATMLWEPSVLLETLGIQPKLPLTVSPPTAEGPAGQILTALTEGSATAEQLAARTGLSTGDLLSELTMLELEGRIMRDGGGYAIKP